MYLDQLVNSVMQNKEEVNKINDYLYDNKLRDLFKSTFKIKNKNITYDDFVKLATGNNAKKGILDSLSNLVKM